VIVRSAAIIALAELVSGLSGSFIPALTWATVIAIATSPMREWLVRIGVKPVIAAILLSFFWREAAATTSTPL
jgi:predicted PurR-regulated permease PerM